MPRRSMLQENKPDATCMHEILEKGTERRAVYLTGIGNKGKSFAYHTH